MDTAVHVTQRRAGGATAETLDRVVTEAPLEIRLNGRPLSVTMRTPGHDEELTLGFLWTARLIEDVSEVLSLAPSAGPPTGQGIDVTVAESVVGRRPWARTSVATASCGICGTECLGMIGVHGRIEAPDDEPRVALDTLLAMPGAMRQAQAVFGVTGGLHAAALFTSDGMLVALREDVGRHNALDKVIGWMLREPAVDASRSVLFVSGRLSFELVAKALSMGVPVIAAVSAPSSLAVEIGLAHGMTVAGFVRDGAANIYAGERRIR